MQMYHLPVPLRTALTVTALPFLGLARFLQRTLRSLFSRMRLFSILDDFGSKHMERNLGGVLMRGTWSSPSARDLLSHLSTGCHPLLMTSLRV